MPTFTNLAFQTIEAEDFSFTAQGPIQNWITANVLPGFTGSGYIGIVGAITDGSAPNSAIAFVQNYTPPQSASFVWFRVAGSGDFVIDYANDANFETITVNGGWTWIRASNMISSQSQIQLIGADSGPLIDKIIITQAVSTPTDPEGFTNVDPNSGSNPPPNTGTGSEGGGTSTEGDCFGTGTTACFANYEAEGAFWLQAGSEGNFNKVQITAASGGEFIRSPSTKSTVDPVIAHISIVPVLTSSWSLWVRARGTGTITHTNADDDFNAVQLSVSSNSWSWIQSPLMITINASKIKFSTLDNLIDIDSFVLIDSSDQPSGVDGFCLNNGSGSGPGPGETLPPPTPPGSGENTEQDINSDRHRWLPENLECRINVVPHELTNK